MTIDDLRFTNDGWRSEGGALQRMRRRWVAFGRLSRAEREVLVRSWMLLPLAGAALRVFGTRRVRAALDRWSAAAVSGGAVPNAVQADEIARLVEAAAWLGPYRAACLPRSLVTWWLLRRRGIASDVRIGVRKGEGRLQAHAWVECDGVALGEAGNPGERFAAFDARELSI